MFPRHRLRVVGTNSGIVDVKLIISAANSVVIISETYHAGDTRCTNNGIVNKLRDLPSSKLHKAAEGTSLMR